MDILIVVDMQNDFIDQALGTPGAVAIVPAVNDEIEQFRQAADEAGDGLPRIFYTLDTHGPGYLQTQEGRNLPVEHCIRGTSGWQLGVTDLSAPYAERMEKGCFGSTMLPERLRALIDMGARIDSIELVGLCTDICVISNAMILKATFPEIPIRVKASCCAGVTPQQHETALAAMRPCQIEIV